MYSRWKTNNEEAELGLLLRPGILEGNKLIYVGNTLMLQQKKTDIKIQTNVNSQPKFHKTKVLNTDQSIEQAWAYWEEGTLADEAYNCPRRNFLDHDSGRRIWNRTHRLIKLSRHWLELTWLRRAEFVGPRIRNERYMKIISSRSLYSYESMLKSNCAHTECNLKFLKIIDYLEKVNQWR